MLLAFEILLLCDLIAYLVIRIVDGRQHARGEDHNPLWLSIALLGTAIAVHAYCSVLLTNLVDTPREVAFALIAFVAAGFPPIAAGVNAVTRSIANGSVDGMYGWRSTASVATYDLTRAHRLIKIGDLHGALREYRRCYEMDPTNPEALFGAAGLLEQLGCLNEAMDAYRDIIKKFPEDSTPWVTAAYRLGLVLENRFNDTTAAAFLFREVVSRRPKTEIGIKAAERLQAAMA